MCIKYCVKYNVKYNLAKSETERERDIVETVKVLRKMAIV